MKFMLFYLGLISFTVAIGAQTELEINYPSLTPDELNQRLNSTIHATRGPALRTQMFANALATNRLDLIRVCFVNQYTCLQTVKAVADMPDSELRQRATITILRTPNGMFWPPENPGIDMHGIEPRLLIEPFISVLPQLLPKVELTENWFKYQIGRTKLADDMEAVLNARGSKSGESARLNEPEPLHITGSVSPDPKNSATAVSDPPPVPAVVSTTIAPAEQNKGVPTFVLVIAGTLGAIILVWLLKLKR